MRFFVVAGLVLLATACSPRLSSGPWGFWHTNRVDRHGDPQGRWRVYSDDANSQLSTRGRYRHGRPVGRWRYYAPVGGALLRQERYHRHGLSDIIYYHPNGQVARTGHARIVDEPGGLHFYWYGEWLSYSDAGVLQKIETYQDGKRVTTSTVKGL
ncbi:MAG: toxin-antitoxin system YwqK family antitoxin [Janthinobacterium lividum]